MAAWDECLLQQLLGVSWSSSEAFTAIQKAYVGLEQPLLKIQLDEMARTFLAFPLTDILDIRVRYGASIYRLMYNIVLRFFTFCQNVVAS